MKNELISMEKNNRKAELQALFILFFAGFAGLLYEVVWIRLLTHVFGVTTYSMSVVVAAFMLGLGAGNYLLGRLADRLTISPYTIVAACQFAIGIYGILSSRLIDLLYSFYPLFSDSTANDSPQNLVVRIVFALIFLVPPTFMMGAGLPVLIQALGKSGFTLSYLAGKCYGADTFGGVLGCLFPAFIFIPRFGITQTLIIGAGLNIIAGLLAIVSMLTFREQVKEQPVDVPSTELNDVSGSGKALIIFALSGFSVLGYEILWTRIVSVVLTTTVYSYAIILASFLVGISLGGFLITGLSITRKNVAITLAIIQATLGASVLVVTWGLGNLPHVIRAIHSLLGDHWMLIQSFRFLSVFFLTGVTTVMAGMTFPLTLMLFSGSRRHLGFQTGKLLLWNSVGSILGSLCAGFLLVPLFGIDMSIIVLVLCNIIASILALMSYHGPVTRMMRLVPILPLLLVMGWFIFVDEPVLLSIFSSRISSREHVVHYAEGISATVMVTAGKSSEVNRIWIDGNNAAAVYYGALQTEKAQGHLAFLAHDNPENVCVICFGTGATLGSVMCDPRVRQVDMVEISPEVINAAHFFKKYNYDALEDPRVNLVLGDGRNHLLVTDQLYDIITSEPMHPSLSGTINLYTTDYYRLCLEKLKPGGILSQWIPLYQMDITDVKALTASLYEIFSHVVIWLNYADIILLCSQEPVTFDLDHAFSRLEVPQIKQDLEMVSFDDPCEFISSVCMVDQEVSLYINEIKPVTDDRPWVEFTAPTSITRKTEALNLKEILAHRPPFPHEFIVSHSHDWQQCHHTYTSLSYMYLGLLSVYENKPHRAMSFFNRASKTNPHNKRLKYVMAALGKDSN